ncbi:acyltransferase family protein [Desulfobacula sp.]|uniref:acyltransferase family protein n=1 Tax=Desulfobacula sp. TaxID=2593537 RepID=UPI002630BB9A|nr:acyltransferase family protein [Desulfobacula sp.]
MQIDEHISKNFSTLKFCSILMVFFGHFFSKSIPLAWVPVTVGLLIFSFSSGFFTAIKYSGPFSKKEFWKRKIKRLGINLFVINIILLVLFLVQDRPGILSWHTLVNIFGLNGFLNWFFIQNMSPYGNGMWFFTLLLIFYMVYPLLAKMGRKGIVVITLLWIGIAYYLSLNFGYGHALWLTSCGFIAGVCAGKTDFPISPGTSRKIAALCLAVMLALNVLFQNKIFNFFFILIFSISFLHMSFDLKVPEKLFPVFAFFSTCLLEIYLFHTYFFVHVTTVLPVDFIISVLIVLFLSKVSSFVSTLIVNIIEGD